MTVTALINKLQKRTALNALELKYRRTLNLVGRMLLLDTMDPKISRQMSQENRTRSSMRRWRWSARGIMQKTTFWTLDKSPVMV